jgi:hypothetical protein
MRYIPLDSSHKGVSYQIWFFTQIYGSPKQTQHSANKGDASQTKQSCYGPGRQYSGRVTSDSNFKCTAFVIAILCCARCHRTFDGLFPVICIEWPKDFTTIPDGCARVKSGFATDPFDALRSSAFAHNLEASFAFEKGFVRRRTIPSLSFESRSQTASVPTWLLNALKVWAFPKNVWLSASANSFARPITLTPPRNLQYLQLIHHYLTVRQRRNCVQGTWPSNNLVKQQIYLSWLRNWTWVPLFSQGKTYLWLQLLAKWTRNSLPAW